MFILVIALELCVLAHSDQLQPPDSGLIATTHTNSQHSVQSQSDQPNESTTIDPSRFLDNVSEKTMPVEKAMTNFNESIFSDEIIGINSTRNNFTESEPEYFADYEDYTGSDDEASGLGQRESPASDSQNNTNARPNQSEDQNSADQISNFGHARNDQTFNNEKGGSYANYPHNSNSSMSGQAWNGRGNKWSWATSTRRYLNMISSGHSGSIGGKRLYNFRYHDRYMYPGYGRLTAKGAGGKGSMSDRDGVGVTETTEAVGQGITVSFEDRKPEATTLGKERLPWQVSVFSKQKTPYVRVCGGSLVTRAAVVSAAHCFWRHAGLLPAFQFAVGAGKVFHRMDDYEYSSHRQHKDVAAIRVPREFGGAAGSPGDIAVLLLAWQFFDEPGLRPVCLSFDRALEERQLVAGSSATVLGVGLQKENAPTELERLEVPYIAPEACGQVLDREMLGNLTGDKMCAGFKPGTSPALGKICSVDAGSGLAFFLARGLGVPYLRGVASALPPAPACGARAVALYTRVRDHRAFLEESLGDLEGECERYYPQTPSFSEEAQFVCNCYC